MVTNTPERFWSLVDKSGDCWNWRGGLNGWGYGQFYYLKKSWRTHRLAYFLVNGKLPDQGLQLDHLCRNRACVNPKHLDVTDNRTNVLRGVGPTAQNARKTHCHRGHEFTEDNTYYRPLGRECRTCKKAHNKERYK